MKRKWALTPGQIELLPCPFCGGPPVPWVGRQTIDGGGQLHEQHIDKDNGTHADAHVWCHECGARSGDVDMMDAIADGASTLVFDMDGVRKLEAVAVRQWNSRSLRNLVLWAAGYEDGHHVYPRPDVNES